MAFTMRFGGLTLPPLVAVPQLSPPAVGMRVKFIGKDSLWLPTGTVGEIVRVFDNDRFRWQSHEGHLIDCPWGIWGTQMVPADWPDAAPATKTDPAPAARLCRRRGCGRPAEDGSPFCEDACFIKENW